MCCYYLLVLLLLQGQYSLNCLFVESRGIGFRVIVLCHVTGTDATVSLTHTSGVNWVEFGGVE